MCLRQYALRSLLLKCICLGHFSTESRHFFQIFGISTQQHLPFDLGFLGWRINSVLAYEEMERLYANIYIF